MITSSFEVVGTYHKDSEKTATLDAPLRLLNEDPALYGRLEDEMDLSLGCEHFKDDGDGDYFDSFFDFTKKNSEEGTRLTDAVGADFFCSRKILVLLAKAAHNFKSTPWYNVNTEIQAIRRKGVIFLLEKEKVSDSAYNSGNGDGYKFEQNMTLDINGRPNSFNAPVSNAECTKRVYRAKFGNGIDHFKVYYAAELDAIDSADRLIEFKTTMLREIKWLERLSLSHYLQAFFGGVPIIVYGHKKFQMNVKHYDNHIIDRVSRKDVSEIPLKARHQWNLSDRMNTMFNTLKTIKEMLPHDDKAILVRIRHGKLNEYIEEPVEDCNFVNDDFLDFFT